VNWVHGIRRTWSTANIKWWLLIQWWAARIKLTKGYLPSLVSAIGFQADGGERFGGLGRRCGGPTGGAMGDPAGAGSCTLRLPFLDKISSYGIRRTMRAHLAGLGAAATTRGWRAAMGSQLRVPTMMAAGSKGRPTSLLGQRDAVQRPEALCESGSAWVVVLRRSGGKVNG
jgi:hypothetical protein